MSDVSFDPKPIRRTRKRHRCNWCGDDIPAGSPCQKIAGVYDGDFSSVHMHDDCTEAWRSLPLDETYEVEGMMRGANRFHGDPEEVRP